MTTTNIADSNFDTNLKTVVEQVQIGNIQSYTYIINHFQRQIYLYCYYLLGSQEEAEDATQDIFIKGLEHIKSFSYTVSFSAWLYKIAHNHCIDLIKKRNKGFKFWENHKKSYEQEHENSHKHKYTEIVHELLEKLNADERRILLLRALEECSFDEIGSIMDLKPSTVRKKYERLRKKLIQQKNLKGEH